MQQDYQTIWMKMRTWHGCLILLADGKLSESPKYLETGGTTVENSWKLLLLSMAGHDTRQDLQNFHFISSTWMPWCKSQAAQGFDNCSREKAIFSWGIVLIQDQIIQFPLNWMAREIHNDYNNKCKTAPFLHTNL